MEQDKKGSRGQRFQRTLRESIGVPVEELGEAAGEALTSGVRSGIKALTGKEIPQAPGRRNPMEYTEEPSAVDMGAPAYGMEDDALAAERADALRRFREEQRRMGRPQLPESEEADMLRKMRLEEASRRIESRNRNMEQERIRLRQQKLQNMAAPSEEDVRALAAEFDRARGQ